MEQELFDEDNLQALPHTDVSSDQDILNPGEAWTDCSLPCFLLAALLPPHTHGMGSCAPVCIHPSSLRHEKFKQWCS